MLTSKKIKIFNSLKREGLAPVNIVTMFLSEQGVSFSDIAKSCDVTRPYVSMVISGKRDSKKVKEQITNALGFDPWA